MFRRILCNDFPPFMRFPRRGSIALIESPGEVSFAASTAANTAANTSIDQKDAAVEDSTAAK